MSRGQHKTADNGTMPVLLLEFTELTPSLMERFVSEGRLPNFKFCTTNLRSTPPRLWRSIRSLSRGSSGSRSTPVSITRDTVSSGLGDGRDLTKPCV
jgi:hypothetical protein